MARGKNKRASAARRSHALATQADELRAEIAHEKDLLAQAEARAAAADDLARQLDQAKATRDRAVAEEIERLTNHVEVLARLRGIAAGHDRDVTREWERLVEQVTTLNGGGHTGLERFMEIAGLGHGSLLVDQSHHVQGDDAVRLQVVRGIRDRFPDHASDWGPGEHAQAVRWLLPVHHYRKLAALGIRVDPHIDVPESPTAEQTAAIEEIDRIA